MRQLHILVVDDEPAIRQILVSQLGKAGHSAESVGSGEEAVAALASGDYEVCICDMRLPGIDGIEVLRRCKAQGVETSFLMITAFASVRTAIDAMKLGAFDYLMKPLQPEDVLHRLNHIAAFNRLRDENRYLRGMVETVGKAPDTLGVSDAIREVESLVDKFARTDGTVLITGESGTGKSYIARAIHQRSPRAEGPLVAVNCGAIPESLLESELFGHMKGAFTGADRTKKGLLREADGGTFFLDEIGELPLGLQVKLLHVIEDREFRPLGAEQTRRVDVRIITATNMDLSAMVREGRFRKDLFYRLNVLHVTLPPLRERRDDVPFFIRHFLQAEVRRLGLEGDYHIDPAAEELLTEYDWPGNLRELQNVIARALVLADGHEVRLSDLPAQVARAARSDALTKIPEGGGTLRELVRRYETQVIRHAMEEAQGDRMAAAQALGIGLSTLYRKLEES